MFAGSEIPYTAIYKYEAKRLIGQLWLYAISAFVLVGAITVIVSGSFRLLVLAAGICLAGGSVGTLVILREAKKDVENMNGLKFQTELLSSEEKQLQERIVFENSLQKYKSLFR